MNEDRIKQVKSAVHHVISNYQLTSKSRLLHRLRDANVDRISKVILERKHDKHLFELLKKRDYYTKKIHELLSDSGEQSDPRLIIDEAEAEHYIRSQLLKDSKRRHEIKALIRKHKNFQESAANEQSQLFHRFRGKKSPINGLKKLGSVNVANEAKADAEKKSEMTKFYTKLLQKQNDFCLESEALLRNLDVPFFNLVTDNNHITQGNKAFVLNFLYNSLDEKL